MHKIVGVVSLVSALLTTTLTPAALGSSAPRPAPRAVPAAPPVAASPVAASPAAASPVAASPASPAPASPADASATPPADAPNWQASWIWDSALPATLPEEADVWMNFRKNVTLSSVPRSVTAHIAAESRYWLYVNGTMVVFEGGLKRGPNTTDGYFDSVELAPYLRRGTNTIAIAVWHWGKAQASFSSSPAGAGGLVFQADVGGQLIISDSTWRVQRDLAYQHSAELEPPALQPNYRLAEKNIYFDARSSIGPWQQPKYDDSQWAAATTRGPVGGAPWNALHARPIPLLKDFGLKDYRNSQDFVGTTTSSQTTLDLRLDYNAQITPYLEIEAPAGLTIDMRTDNYSDPAGNGNTVKSVYVTTDGPQTFEALGWFNGEHVYYSMPAGITIKALKYRETGYDTTFSGSFTSSDAFMNSLWQKSLRTLYITMRDNFMDCPDRERAQWWGDVTNEMMMSMYALDQQSYLLYEKGLNTKLGFVKDDVLYTVTPALGYDANLPMQELAGIAGVWEYYLYTGRKQVIANSYQAMKNYTLKKWTVQPNGLVSHYGGTWDWMDWGNNADVPAIENAWYYLAVRRLSQMAGELGKTADVAVYQDIQDRIKVGYRQLWTSAGYQSANQAAPDDRANALAVLSGLASADQYPAITSVLQKTFNSSPYMEKYVLDALVAMGAMDAAQQRIKTRYAPMVEGPQAYSTLWEFWDKQAGTKNHAWSGGPLITMSKDMAGVAPTSPGYRSYQVKPALGTLTQAKTRVPSVIGNIDVDVRQNTTAKTVDLTVTAPSGGAATIAVPRFAGQQTRILVDGKPVFNSGKPAATVAGLTYKGNDSRYVYFAVRPGTWTFHSQGMEPKKAGQVNLNISGTGGSVTINGKANTLPYKGKVRVGSQLTLTAVPNSGHTFGGWSGAVGSTANPLTLTIRNDLNLAVTFPKTPVSPYKLVRVDDPDNAGMVVEYDGRQYRTPTGFVVKTGAQTTIRAVVQPAGDFNFVGWSGDVVTAHPSVTVTADTDKRLAVRSVFQRTANIALHQPVSATNSLGGGWAESNLTDGNLAAGFSTNTYPARDVSTSPAQPVVTIDLGQIQSFDTVTLYPRTGAVAADGTAPNYPADFVIQTSDDGQTFTDARRVQTTVNPLPTPQAISLPSTVRAQFVRLRVNTLGLPATDEATSPAFRLQLMEMGVSRASGFGEVPVTITGAGDGSGTVLVNGVDRALPFTATVPEGSGLTVDFHPAAGSRGSGWSGNFSSTARVIYLTPREPTAMTAHFSADGSPGDLALSGRYPSRVGESTTVTVNIAPTSAGNKSVVWSVESAGGRPSTVADLRVQSPTTAVLTAREAGIARVVARFADGSGVASARVFTVHD